MSVVGALGVVMPVVVQCPKCQAKLRGPDELAGKSVRCKRCREKFRIPDANLDSMTETQQISTVGVSAVLPTVAPAPDAFVPAAVAPAGTSANPLPLDDLMLEELPPARQTNADALDAADLLEEPAPRPVADPFAFDEPAPEPIKKKKRRPADDEEREEVASEAAKPKKKPRSPDEDDEAAAPAPPPAAASADPFAFDASAPEPVQPKKKKRAADEPPPGAVQPKKKKRAADDEKAEDDRPRERRRPAEADDEEHTAKRAYQKKSGASWGLLIGVLVVLVAVGGGLAAVFLLKPKDKEEANTKVEPPPASKPKAKGEEPKGEEPKGGEPQPPTPPRPIPEPPVKNDPPPPAGETLPAAPTGKLTVVGKLAHQLALAIPTYMVREVRVAGTSAVVAFNSQFGFQGAGAQDTIRQYSVRTGAAGREFVIDSSGLVWPRAFAVSGNGEIVAVEAGGPGQVTVYDFETGTALLDKKDVFAGLTGRVGPVAALAVGTGRKLFVVDQAGTVDVWDLATGARTVTGTPPKRTAAGKPAAKACAISGGAAVAVALDNKVWAVDAAGKTTGTGATLPAPDAVPLAVAGGPGEDRAAVMYRLSNGRFGVAGVHPISGNVEYHTPLPDGSGTPVAVGWPDATILSVSTGQAGFLIDTEERAVTAYLKGIGGGVNLFPTGGELWWLTIDDTDLKKSTLRAADPRFDGYPALAKQARAERQPVYLVPGPNGLAK